MTYLSEGRLAIDVLLFGLLGLYAVASCITALIKGEDPKDSLLRYYKQNLAVSGILALLAAGLIYLFGAIPIAPIEIVLFYMLSGVVLWVAAEIRSTHKSHAKISILQLILAASVVIFLLLFIVPFMLG